MMLVDDQPPGAVHEGKGGGVATRDAKEDDEEPVEAIPVEQHLDDYSNFDCDDYDCDYDDNVEAVPVE